MQNLRVRNAACAVAGLAAFAACILACATSFSPDDRQVLFPTFDIESGALSVSVYDRPSRTARQAFVAGLKSTEPSEELMLPRAQWLPDGKRFVASWSQGGGNDVAHFALISVDGRGPVRVLHWEDLDKENSFWARPLPMIGTRVFTVVESNLVSLDLVSAQITSRALGEKLAVVLVPITNRLGYAIELENGESEFGLLDPETAKRIWRLQVPHSRLSSIAFSPVGHIVALVPDTSKVPAPRLELIEDGKPPRELDIPVEDKETLKLGYSAFSPKGDILFVSFTIETDGSPGTAFGFIECPLDGKSPRRTTLFRGVTLGRHEDVSLALFEFGLAHDGKTLAVSSAGVAFASESMQTEDCALFLVDLADPARKVTKVPIPLPANHVTLKH